MSGAGKHFDDAPPDGPFKHEHDRLRLGFQQFADHYEQFRHMAAIVGGVIARGGA
jgi:hypothetical protein